ncbi:MAG: hypothetical protein VYC47_06730 [Verrucomicrobiota bacterium]|nr:hypothetical protein [Verrucomicrobiota bacterium]
MADEKLNRLRDILRGYESCLVAYSGGVDSVLLAHVAHEALAGRMLAVLAEFAAPRTGRGPRNRRPPPQTRRQDG